MLTLHLRAIARRSTLVLTLLLTLGPLLRTESYAAAPALSAQGGTQYNLVTPAQSEQTQAGSALPPNQAALNLAVRISLASAGWHVTALNSQLDDSSASTDANISSGSGQWHVEATDQNGQPLTLDGVLTFTLQAEARASQGFTVIESTDLSGLISASSTVTGTLSGPGVAASLNLVTDLTNTGDATRQTTDLSVQISHNGQESLIKSTGQAESRLIAYNVMRQVVTSSLERDGNRIEATQTTTVRSFAHNESEVWLQFSSTNVNSGKAITGVNEHLFQRIVESKASQFIDRFDLTTPFGSYTLKEPGTATITLGQPTLYNYTLLDKNGTEFNPGDISSGRPPGLSSVLPLVGNSANSPPRVSPSMAEMSAEYSLAEPLGQSRGGSRGGRSSGRTPEQQAAKEQQAAVVTGAAVAVAVVGAAAIADAAAAAAADTAAAALAGRGAVTVAGEAAAETSAFGGAAGSGAATVSGGLSNASLARNADPYFVYPDLRPNADTVDPSPVQITRVTGGLMTTVPTTTLVITATGASTTTLQGGDAPLYTDDPVPFVGGSIPAGGQAVGEWTWDSSHPYGAIQSHTQARTDGPQMHYFIHGSHPLTASQDTNIIQYVYLDPQHMPSEIYLQFYTGDGNGERRAYWGEDKVQTGGGRGTPSLYPMGPLPGGGGWVRLQVPADKLGLVGNPINGVLYGIYGGQTWWGPTTTSNRLLDNVPDLAAVQSPAPMLTTTHGAEIAFRLSAPTSLSITILNQQGQQVRSLSKDLDTQAGYRVVTWDAHDDAGTAVADIPYKVQFSHAGQMVAEQNVTITPLVASIQTPGSFSLVRGNQVPVIGEAYGDGFSGYVLEYGEGLNPASWQTIVSADAPVILPAGSSLHSFNPGNIANWNVGVDEYRPWKQAGLNGLYTLRLRVLGKDGREASTTVPLIVGRLAHTAETGTITSPNGMATLTIPALATTSPFSIMALIPLSQLEPDGAWRANLPNNSKLLGEVYEVFPADETFRRPATLELSYGGGTPGQVGVLLGDGTRGGWHYIGGRVDPQRGVISVPVADFGGKRALVAAFASDNFGLPPADPAAGARLTFSDTDTVQPISIVSSTAPLAFSSDLESSPGEWEALDVNGTHLERVTGADAGLTEGDSALKVTHEAGGERLVQVRSTPYDANKYPIISFSYRLPADYAPDLMVRSNGVWWQLRIGTNASVDTGYFHSLYAPKLVSDDTWHIYRVDLLALLRGAQPGASNFQVDGLVLGQFKRVAYMQVAIVDSGETGSAYYIDNFAALRPTNAANLSFSWASGGTATSAYSFALSQDPGTVPPETATGTSTQATLSLPPEAEDGLWYFHLRGQGTNGQWGAAVHIPLLVDRQPPQLGRPDPPPDGAGSPEAIQLPLVDKGGVDAATLQLKMGSNSYTWAGAAPGGGLQYDLETGSLLVYRNLLDPKIPEPPTGQKVELTVEGLADYAGNKLSAPFSWTFTADQPELAGDVAFRQLTSNGGDSPAIAPDGSQIAFVSSRSGVEKIWVMRSDDYEEKAGSATLLTGNRSTGRESDPQWSPDGKTLAYVSDATGSTQLWLAAPDGSSVHVLTTGEGGAASPTWLWQPNGGATQALAFVHDGNLWQVNTDGTGLHALTTYPEKPVRSVRAQPGGSLLAVGFKLYQQTVELYDPGSGLSEAGLQPITNGANDKEPAWLDSNTILYTAPASQNGLDAIWQISSSAALGQSAGGSVIFGDSAHPGAADMQPDAALDGSSVAIVSTRGGDRNIWLRHALQIASLDVSPSVGVAAGESMQISYTLPASATVTLGIEDSSGKTVRLLLDGVAQGEGMQALAWDGTGPDNQALPGGDYLAHLSAKVNNVVLTRRASVRLLAPSDKGTLRLEIQQWAGQPFQPSSNLSVSVYAEGTRDRPVAEAIGTNPHFDLPAGRYDLLVEYNGARNETHGVVVEGGKETSLQIDMGLGGVEVALFMAANQPASGSAYVTVSRSDDPAGIALLAEYAAAPDFILPPGKYNLKIEFGDITKRVYGVQVERGKVKRQEVSLESGVLKLIVYSRDGTPAEGNGRLSLQVVKSQDHSQVVATNYDNPLELALPAGLYDIRVEYSTAISGESASLVGGSIISWINGVEIKSGQTTSLEQNLKLTPVTVTILEAPGKPADPAKITFRVYPKGDSIDHYVAYAYTDLAHIELPEGVYDVQITYENTELRSESSIGGPIEVKYGNGPSEGAVDHTINLGLGHIHISVVDPAGTLVSGDGLSAGAAPANQPDTPFASDRDHNPLDLPVRAGVVYNISVRSGYGKALTLGGKQVKEGEVLDLTVSIQDLK